MQKGKKVMTHKKHCPICNAPLIDDVWEEIIEDENGSLHQRIIVPAWVCSQFCGYYQENNHEG